MDGFSQEALKVASGVLNAVKRAFDMFTNMVGTFGRPQESLSRIAFISIGSHQHVHGCHDTYHVYTYSHWSGVLLILGFTPFLSTSISHQT